MKKCGAPNELDGEMRSKASWHHDRLRKIRRLYAADDEFQTVWDDYREASMAYRRFRSLGEHEMRRTEEYRELREELAAEVRSRLNDQTATTSFSKALSPVVSTMVPARRIE